MADESRPLTEERKAVERLIFRLIVTVLVSVLVLTCTGFIWDKSSPFILCIPIAAVLQPVVNFLVKKCRMKRSPASALLVVLILLLLIAALFWFVTMGIKRLNTFIGSAPTLLAGVVNSIRSGSDDLLGNLEAISPDVVNWLRGLMNEALSWITVQSTALGGKLVTLLTGMAAKLPDAFIYLNFLMVAMFFITRDYPRIRARLPGGKAYDPNSNASQLTKAGIMGALAYLRMQTIYGVISFFVGGIYFTLFHMPYAWLIALAAGFLEFLPLFGNGTLYIPWSIAAYVLGDARTGTLVIVLYLILITFRRCTEPKIMSDSIGVSPLTSLIGMFVGLRMGGILGLIGGPIVMTILGAVVHGTYLVGIRKDLSTLMSWAWRRWDWATPSHYVPPEEKDAEDEPAALQPEKKAGKRLRPFGKKKK